MKRIIFIAALLLAVSFQLRAQTTDSTLVISFTSNVYDYGTIEQGGNGDCEFVFTNKGNSPLLLTNVRASCGCTTPNWTREPIQPGKEGVIKVKYDTNRIGAFNKTITVNSNAVNSTLMLSVKGTVVAKQ
jgi:hypothetical protein